MKFVFDPAKDAANVAKHGLSLAEFRGFDTEAQIRIDDRYDYAETRYRVGQDRGSWVLRSIHGQAGNDAGDQLPPGA